MKNIISYFIALAFLFIRIDQVDADVCVVTRSAKPKVSEINLSYDSRVHTLKNYLDSHDSPMAKYADKFVSSADKYNLDWRLVPAIAGVESTFGKRIPLKSYNAYGWANGNYYFESWDDSIEHVSKTLRLKYYDNGTESINAIARRYAPPSNTWSNNVKWFMKQIERVPVQFTI